MSKYARLVDELTSQIQQLPQREQCRVLKRVLTPELRLRLAVASLRRQAGAATERQVAGAVRAARRQAQRERQSGETAPGRAGR